jgi:phosphopantothenate synthetase
MDKRIILTPLLTRFSRVSDNSGVSISDGFVRVRQNLVVLQRDQITKEKNKKNMLIVSFLKMTNGERRVCLGMQEIKICWR